MLSFFFIYLSIVEVYGSGLNGDYNGSVTIVNVIIFRVNCAPEYAARITERVTCPKVNKESAIFRSAQFRIVHFPCRCPVLVLLGICLAAH